MDQSNKQRIVGILVILIAAVVLLPIMFDGEGSYQMPLESRIPDPVPFPSVPRVIPERPVVVADTDQIRLDAADDPGDAAAEPQAVTPSAPEQDDDAQTNADVSPPVQTPAPAVEAPGLDNVGLPEGWSVRLASFSNQTNARNLVERLQSRGHRAYTREIQSAQGILTAVFVGPGVDRTAVQQLQRQLQEEFDLAGIVVRYEIEGL